MRRMAGIFRLHGPERDYDQQGEGPQGRLPTLMAGRAGTGVVTAHLISVFDRAGIQTVANSCGISIVPENLPHIGREYVVEKFLQVFFHFRQVVSAGH